MQTADLVAGARASPKSSMEVLALGRNRALLSAVLISLSLISVALLAPPFYQTNDDTWMRLIAEGFLAPSGRPEPILIFIGAPLGSVISFANTIMPGIPWYDIFLYAVLFSSVTALVYCLLRERLPLLQMTLLGVALATFLMPFAVKFQFTMVAMIGSASGLLFAIASAPRARSKQTKRLAFAISAGLTLAGCLIRFEAALIALSFIALLSAPSARKIIRGRRWSTIGHVASGAALGVAIGISCHLFSKLTITGTPGWEEFLRFNDLRVMLTELRPRGLHPDRIEAMLTAAGWSRNDFSMLNSWFFDDREIFSVERMTRAVDALYAGNGWLDLFLLRVREGMWRAPQSFTDSLPYYFQASALILTIGFTSRGQARMTALYAVLGAWCMIAMLSLALKWAPYRIAWPVLALAGCYVILRIAREESDARMGSILPAILVLGLSTSILWGLHRDALQSSLVRQAVTKDIARFQSESKGNQVLVSVGGSFPAAHLVSPFRPSPWGANGRLVLLGLAAQTPYVRDFLVEHNSFASAICRDERFRITAKPSLIPVIEKFVAEHHRLEVMLQPDFAGEAFTTYKCAKK